MSEDKTEKLKSFLHAYAEASRDVELVLPYLPLKMHVSMAGGACVAQDKNGNRVAGFSVGYTPDGEECYHPSIPVHPAAIWMCSAFVDAMNSLAVSTPPRPSPASSG